MRKRILSIGLATVLAVSLPVSGAMRVNATVVPTGEIELTNETDTEDVVSETGVVDVPTVTASSVYTIGSQEDWDNLVSGVVDATRWTSGSYNGVEDIEIKLDCDIVTNTDVLNISENNVSVVLDLNGHTFQSSTGVFTFDADGSNNVNVAFITLKNGTVSATKIMYKDTQNGTAMTVSGVDFTGCQTSALDLEQIDTISISDCTFVYDTVNNDSTDAIAINVKYTNHAVIDTVTIQNFHTGINTDNSTTRTQIKNSSITGAFYGVHAMMQSHGVGIDNCELMGNQVKGSCGVYMQGDGSSNLIEKLNNSDYLINNSVISDFYAGVYCYTSFASVANSTIANCNIGCTGGHGTTFNGSGAFLVNNCQLSSVQSPDDESYGICCTTAGLLCINSTVEGFKYGVGNVYNNSGSASAGIFSCKLGNIDTNLLLHCGEVIGCELTRAKVGVYAYNATTCIYDTSITGPGENVVGSCGILDGGAATIHCWNIDENVTIDKASLNYFGEDVLPYLTANNLYIPKEAVIQGFEKGLSINRSANTVLANAEIKDCVIGVSSEQGANTYFYDNIIHNCNQGAIVKSMFVPGTTKVYDCDEEGVVSTSLLTNGGSAINNVTVTPLLESYNNGVGVKVINGTISGMPVSVHDNDGDGLQLEGSNTSAYTTLSAYNNGGWNVNCLDKINTFLITPGNMQTQQYTDGSLGNMKLNTSGEFRYATCVMKSDNSQYFLVPNQIMQLSPSGMSTATGWLDGTMTFHLDDADYTNGRTLANAVNETVGDDLYVSTHFFMLKDGWVVKLNAVPQGSTTLEVAEGCEVVYDYEHNGGTSWSGDFEKRSYVKDSVIDLSYTATKSGYEFVGWNTDPDAHEGLSQLSAGTQNVTLYAIYRKEITLTYHTYSDSLDYSQSGFLFNNKTTLYSDNTGKKLLKLLPYEVAGAYKCIGYTFDETTDNLSKAGDEIPDEVTDIYCVYSVTGTLIYQDIDGRELYTYNQTNVHVAESVISNTYRYEVTGYIPTENYKFDGWVYDEDVYLKGEFFTTARNKAVLTATVSELPRLVTVTGRLLDAFDKPIANAIILLNKKGIPVSTGNTIIASEAIYKSVTDANGYYIFENVPVGTYVCTVNDVSGNQLAVCEVSVNSHTEKRADAIQVTEKQSEVRVKSSIDENIFTINVSAKQHTTPLTGDNSVPIVVSALGLTGLAGAGVILLKKNRKE